MLYYVKAELQKRNAADALISERGALELNKAFHLSRTPQLLDDEYFHICKITLLLNPNTLHSSFISWELYV